ncbi:MAG TPA: phosphatidylserine decarboxylase family protein [Chitinophagaceae bacterium]|nr:phosphatidylserine decarboxylase family protein [Chitinophagaceae bacterium]
MTIHKEGYATLEVSFIGLAILDGLLFFFLKTTHPTFCWLMLILTAAVWIFLVSFFRVPSRKLVQDEDLIFAPADGRVVVIEETREGEFFMDQRIQVSIFMSPANVHLNRNPIGGTVKYSKYHPGKFLVAWHPKSSLENERHTTVIAGRRVELLVRQIAGAMARRIVNYLKEGDQVVQNQEMGFIKFGSRVDLFFPVNVQILVEMDQLVLGGVTAIARIP